MEQYDEEPENIWPNKEVLPIRHRLQTDNDNMLYFVMEQDEARLEELAKKYPTAIFIQTGYSHPSLNRNVLNRTAMEFFYKTHPDYQDLMTLSQCIPARQTIYFHSTHTNLATTFKKEEINYG